MIRHDLRRALPLALLLVIAPLPFASVAPPYAMALFGLTALALAIALAMRGDDDAAPDPRAAASSRTAIASIASIAAIAGVGVLGLLQSVGLPGRIAAAIGPGIVLMRQQAAGLIGAPVPEWIALSLAPDSSRFAAAEWLLAAAAAAAAFVVGRMPTGRRTLATALVASAAIQIAIGVQLWISRSDSLWGVALPHFPNRLRGSFINPNHLALFLEIALAVAFAWLWWSARRAFRDHDHAEARLAMVGPAAIAFLFVFAGLVLTGSRAGVLAAVAGLGVQGYLVGRRRGRRWLLGAGLLAAAAGVALVAAFGIEGSLTRILATPLDEVGGSWRVHGTAATLELWQRFPLTGVGLGAFRAAFPLVQPESMPGLWRHAHSDWAELLATTGLVGAGLVGVALYFTVSRIRRVVSKGVRSEDRAAGIAAVGALVAVGLHSFADFGLTMPANAFAFAVVLGAAAGAETVSRVRPSPPAA